MARTATRTDLTYLDTAAPLPVAAEIALRVAVIVTRWAERQRSRKALGHLDKHLLKDVGLTAREARREANRRFWQG